MPEKVLKSVASKHHLTADQVRRILDLLDADFSIPYILRYHKDLAANLEPDDFYDLMDGRDRIEKLETRRRKILKKLRDREVLTDDLEHKIEQAGDLRELVDYYVPFRPRKRSRSRLALAQGLGPLATEVLSQREFIPDMGAAAEECVDPEKDLSDVESVLEGVFHIVTDWIAEEKSHRDCQRKVLREQGEFVVSRVKRSLPGRLVRDFKPYFDFRRPISKLHPYHLLMILRGKQQKALECRVEPPLEAMERAAAGLYLPGGAGQLEQVLAELGETPHPDNGQALKSLNGLEFVVACMRYSLREVLCRIVVREIDKLLAKEAESLALEIVRRNVKNMLMAPPVRQRVLAIHPGYRTGCNLAALDENGKVLETVTVYPHAPQQEREAAVEGICRLITEHELRVVAIGEGTALEETEDLIAELIAAQMPEVQYATVSELGLDTYCSSRGAKNDLPDTEPDERYAVAVGRRLQDPLAEYVKVNPRRLCPEPYVEDVNGGALKTLLDRLIEECVCSVGVNVNTAHHSLLRYVSGLDPVKALEVVTYRDKNGPLTNRAQLAQVPKIGQDSYERAVGFVKMPDSDNWLDSTRIHPRLYPVAQSICEQLELTVEDLATEEGRETLKKRRSEIQLTELEKQFDVHYLLLKDVIDEMLNPWPDPRSENAAPILRRKRLSLADLKPEQWLDGTVRNIVDFGVFVDVGVGEDGLIHISELSDGYVETPYDVVSIGDSVRVRVVRVDEERSRIALSLREESSARERPERRRGRPRAASEPAGEPTQKTEAQVPERKPSRVSTPRSTGGWDSRRVQRVAVTDRLSKTQQQILKKRETPAPAPSPEPEQAVAAAAEDQPEPEQAPAQEKEVGSLLQRLDFANIERRGKSAD